MSWQPGERGGLVTPASPPQTHPCPICFVALSALPRPPGHRILLPPFNRIRPRFAGITQAKPWIILMMTMDEIWMLVPSETPHSQGTPPTPLDYCQGCPGAKSVVPWPWGPSWPPCLLHPVWLSQPLGCSGDTGQHLLSCPSSILVLLAGCLCPRFSPQVTCETVTDEDDSGWFSLWGCGGRASPGGSPGSWQGALPCAPPPAPHDGQKLGERGCHPPA